MKAILKRSGLKIGYFMLCMILGECAYSVDKVNDQGWYRQMGQRIRSEDGVRRPHIIIGPAYGGSAPVIESIRSLAPGSQPILVTRPLGGWIPSFGVQTGERLQLEITVGDADPGDTIAGYGAYLACDLTHDGVVNISDMAFLAPALRTRPGSLDYNPEVDVFRTGFVNELDFMNLYSTNLNKQMRYLPGEISISRSLEDNNKAVLTWDTVGGAKSDRDYFLTLVAGHVGSISDKDALTIKVTIHGNDPLRILSIGGREVSDPTETGQLSFDVNEGELIKLPVVFHDPEGDDVNIEVYLAGDLPNGSGEHDGNVNLGDITFFEKHMGRKVGDWWYEDEADFDNDKEITLGDYSLMGRLYNRHATMPDGVIQIDESGQLRLRLPYYEAGQYYFTIVASDGREKDAQTIVVNVRNVLPITAANLNGDGKDEMIVHSVQGGPGLWARYEDPDDWVLLNNVTPNVVQAGDLDGQIIYDVEGEGTDARMVEISPDDLVVSFKHYGIWIYYNGGIGDYVKRGWEQILTEPAEEIVIGDFDTTADGLEVIADLGPEYGIRMYVPHTGAWREVHGLSGEEMVAVDIPGNGTIERHTLLFVDFGEPYGVWRWVLVQPMDSDQWVQLHGSSPERMVAGDLNGDGADELVLDFGDPGIWSYDNRTVWIGDGPWLLWTKLHASSSGFLATGNVDGGSDDLIVVFKEHGTWIYRNNTSWDKLHEASPGFIATGDLDSPSITDHIDSGLDEVIMDLGINGIWAMYNYGALDTDPDNSGWRRLL